MSRYLEWREFVRTGRTPNYREPLHIPKPVFTCRMSTVASGRLGVKTDEPDVCEVTAGFVGKLYLFAAAVQNEYYWLAAIGLVMSAVSMYYYGRIIMVLYMENRGETQEVMSLSSAPSLFFAMVVLVVGTLLLGIFPGSFLDAAKGTVAGFI